MSHDHIKQMARGIGDAVLSGDLDRGAKLLQKAMAEVQRANPFSSEALASMSMPEPDWVVDVVRRLKSEGMRAEHLYGDIFEITDCDDRPDFTYIEGVLDDEYFASPAPDFLYETHTCLTPVK